MAERQQERPSRPESPEQDFWNINVNESSDEEELPLDFESVPPFMPSLDFNGPFNHPERYHTVNMVHVMELPYARPQSPFLDEASGSSSVPTFEGLHSLVMCPAAPNCGPSCLPSVGLQDESLTSSVNIKRFGNLSSRDINRTLNYMEMQLNLRNAEYSPEFQFELDQSIAGGLEFVRGEREIPEPLETIRIINTANNTNDPNPAEPDNDSESDDEGMNIH